MSSPPFDIDRRLVPRWRASKLLLQQVEAKPLSNRPSEPNRPSLETERAHSRWLANPSIEFASDVVISSITDGNEALGFGPAEQLIREGSSVAPSLVELARRVRYGPTPETSEAGAKPSSEAPSEEIRTIRAELRRLRHRVRDYARDPYAWHDLALLYARIGESDAARDAGRISVALAPENRIILRSTARLLLHVHEPEDALAIVRRSERTAFDPWLASVEIALSDILGKTPRLVKRANGLLKSFEDRPEVVSELAASLGTLEALGGSTKLARSHFKTALKNPSENVVTQARWIANRVPAAINFDRALLERTSAFEGRALQHYHNGDWSNALTQIDAWLDDEPFSSRPAVLGSFIAATLLTDPIKAERLANRGLIANPHDQMLLNNLAYAIAYSKRPERAFDVADRFPVHASSFQRTYFEATRGLIYMKTGALDAGRQLYERAVKFADEKPQEGPQFYVRLYYAIAELESASPRSERIRQLVEQAKGMLKKENVVPSAVRGLALRINSLLAEPKLPFAASDRSHLSKLLMTD